MIHLPHPCLGIVWVYCSWSASLFFMRGDGATRRDAAVFADVRGGLWRNFPVEAMAAGK
jgi:hypothetical protein